MFKRNTLRSVALLGAAIFSIPAVYADSSQSSKVVGQVFSASYQPVPAVPSTQAQVVYYRAGTPGPAAGAAHIYLDKEFHTGLLPSGFSAFCLAPGTHTLGAYLNDAPLYKGKASDMFEANLQGGQTYFVRVEGDGGGIPRSVERVEAERELVDSRAQIHALSRASVVQACQYVQSAALVYKDYTLAGDVLFNFGKSGYRDISAEGKQAVRELITQLHRDHAELDRILVVGHTDPVGSQAGNQLLGLKRASTIRRLLIDGGLPSSSVSASSAGGRELVVQGCYDGNKVERNACNAPNRRVVVRVDVSRSESSSAGSSTI